MTINKCHNHVCEFCALTKCNAAMKNGYFMAKNTHTHAHAY